MFDEKDTTRHIHRGARKDPDRTVEVDSSAFFAPQTAQPVTPPPSKKPPRQNSSPARPPQKPSKKKGSGSKFGSFLLVLQAVLSVAAFVQLCRTRMLPALYLVIIAALLALFWLLVKRCQEYRTPGRVSRVFSVFLCAALALGCVWAQQGLAALGSVTSGLLTGAEANKITKEPFVVYLSGVDTRGELTEKARSDVNILAVVNPATKRVALINTPRDYYVDLAGTSSKDKLTHAGMYGVETSMATLGNLYGVNVEHYIRINFAGFISIIDAVGGVDVYSDQAFTSVGSPGYYDPTTFAEGWNHLDGKSALAFARERHAFASGDIQRGINQMKVIDAMANKLKSPTVLMSFSKLMDAVSDCFVTSLSQEQISALVRMQLSDLANWDIQSYSVTGSSGKSSQCYSAKGQSLYVMKPDESSRARSATPSRLRRRPKSTRRRQTPTPPFPCRRPRRTASSWTSLRRASRKRPLPAASSPQRLRLRPLPKPRPATNRLPPPKCPPRSPLPRAAAPLKHRPSLCPHRSRSSRPPPRSIRRRPPFWMPCSVPAAPQNKTPLQKKSRPDRSGLFLVSCWSGLFSGLQLEGLDGGGAVAASLVGAQILAGGLAVCGHICHIHGVLLSLDGELLNHALHGQGAQVVVCAVQLPQLHGVAVGEGELAVAVGIVGLTVHFEGLGADHAGGGSLAGCGLRSSHRRGSLAGSSRGGGGGSGGRCGAGAAGHSKSQNSSGQCQTHCTIQFHCMISFV